MKAVKEHVASEGSTHHGPHLLVLGEDSSVFPNLEIGLGLNTSVRCIKQSARNNQSSLATGCRLPGSSAWYSH